MCDYPGEVIEAIQRRLAYSNQARRETRWQVLQEATTSWQVQATTWHTSGNFQTRLGSSPAADLQLALASVAEDGCMAPGLGLKC